MKRVVFLFFAISLAVSPTSGRGASDEQSLAIRGGKIVTVSGGVVENGTIVVRHGKIESVGENVDVPTNARRIDLPDKTVVPGFIDAHCHLGLSLNVLGEIDEMVQPVSAEMQIVDAFDNTARSCAMAIRSGITTAMLAPGSRNPIGGQTAAVKLAGASADRWLLSRTAGIKFSFTDDALMSDRRPTSRPGLIALVKEHLDQAKGDSSGEFDLSAEVFSRLQRRELTAYIYAQTVDEIAAALSVIEEYDLKVVLVGARQADEIAETIVKREIPVIYGPLLWRSKDKDLARVAKLADAGATLAFASFAPRSDPGDIRTSAILAVRYGLDREDALKALTLNAARLLGLEGRIGSIQKDRDADLVVLDGDPLEPSSRIEMVIVDGSIVYRREQK